MLYGKRGFTLVELVVVVVVIGILTTVAVKTFAPMADRVRIEETRREMDGLVRAMVGNPDLENGGTRGDFGYVGDIGSLPSGLDDLRVNPGYGTWQGPYIENGLAQVVDDFKKDAWQSQYIYNGGVTITSGGSGENIVRKIAASEDDVLRNRVSGNIFDIDGTPPGTDYSDSILIRLTVPDGSGGMVTKSSTVDVGGFFEFDSIPIGNHDLQVVYLPDSDTLNRFVSVIPNSNIYGEYYLSDNLSSPPGGGPTGTGIEFVADSDSLTTGNCFKMLFWITNHTGGAITVSSLTLTWSSPPAYYKNVIWDGSSVRSGNPALGAGDAAVFSSTRTINDGETIRIQVEEFHSNSNGGGPPVDMTGTDFTVEFSDGSSFTFTADLCTN